jgi:hypothetical protein
MFTRNKLLIIGTIVSIYLLAGLTQGSIQVYESDSGKIKLDLPMTLSLTSQSSGYWLDLTKPGNTKPIIAIRLQEPYGENFEKYASSTMGSKYNPTKTLTDDGHNILYFAETTGTQRQYTAFIDYLKEKNKIIQIWTFSEVHANGETLATFDSDGALKIAKSFAFINDTQFQAIKAGEAKSTPGFEIILTIMGLLGVLCIIRKLNNS